MRFDHPEYHTKKNECWFELPDSWTVRLILNYDSRIELGISLSQSYYVRLWNALNAIILEKEWHIKGVPLNVSLDEVSDKKTLDIIKWASMAGFSARRAMDADEKN